MENGKNSKQSGRSNIGGGLEPSCSQGKNELGTVVQGRVRADGTVKRDEWVHVRRRELLWQRNLQEVWIPPIASAPRSCERKLPTSAAHAESGRSVARQSGDRNGCHRGQSFFQRCSEGMRRMAREVEDTELAASLTAQIWRAKRAEGRLLGAQSDSALASLERFRAAVQEEQIAVQAAHAKVEEAMTKLLLQPRLSKRQTV